MKRRWVTFNFIFCLRLWLNLGNLGGSQTWCGAKGGYKGGLHLRVLSGAGQITAIYIYKASNQHKMMTIIVYRRLLKMKSVEDRIDQVSRQTICVISPDQRATSNRSMVSQILLPSAYDCFKLHLLSTCLSITRNHLIRIEGCCSATEDSLCRWWGSGQWWWGMALLGSINSLSMVTRWLWILLGL